MNVRVFVPVPVKPVIEAGKKLLRKAGLRKRELFPEKKGRA